MVKVRILVAVSSFWLSNHCVIRFVFLSAFPCWPLLQRFLLQYVLFRSYVLFSGAFRIFFPRGWAWGLWLHRLWSRGPKLMFPSCQVPQKRLKQPSQGTYFSPIALFLSYLIISYKKSSEGSILISFYFVVHWSAVKNNLKRIITINLTMPKIIFVEFFCVILEKLPIY